MPLSDREWRESVVSAFEAADAEFLAIADRRNLDDGSCACACVLVAGDGDGDRKLVAINAGDSRRRLRWNQFAGRRPARDIFKLLCLAQIELVFHDS